MAEPARIQAIEAALVEKVLRAVEATRLPAEVEIRLIVALRDRGITRHV